ncbi:MAG TPA: gas vesicle protein GvpO [Gaiellaceae bacterium]|jgi:hypothetical protein|nr:gas vesicle protein GvpO [Gaiellaceae bacterium]
MADREEAKRNRTEARERRRKAGQKANEEETQSSDTPAAPTREQAIEEVKHAAKVAAASAAVGAAVAAARALATRDGESEAHVQDRRSEEPVAEVPADASEPDAESTAAQSEPEAQPQAEAGESRDALETADRDEGPSARAESDRPSAGDIENEPKADEKPLMGAPPETARSAVARAKEQLESLLGRTPESVSSLERRRDGWLVTLEVVEVARIPESTDVLASYEMELDGDGNLRRYGRVRRYRRSQADNGDGS